MTNNLDADIAEVLQPLVETYWRMVGAARFRPGHSGYRDETLNHDGGPNWDEATEWAADMAI